MGKIARLDIQNIRIIIFDSTEIEKEAKKKSHMKLSEVPSFSNYSPSRRGLQDLGAGPSPRAPPYNNLIDQIILEEKYEENEGTPPASPPLSPRGQSDLDHRNSPSLENEEHKKFFNDQFKPNLFSFDSIASRSAFIINF